MCTGNLKFRKLDNRRQDMEHLKLHHSLHRATRKPRLVNLKRRLTDIVKSRHRDSLHRATRKPLMINPNLHRRRLTDLVKSRHRDSLHRCKHQVTHRPLPLRNLHLTENSPIPTGSSRLSGNLGSLHRPCQAIVNLKPIAPGNLGKLMRPNPMPLKPRGMHMEVTLRRLNN